MKYFYNQKIVALTTTETHILNWIEDHPNEFMMMSITELAKASIASVGSITTLSQKLGFKKLKDMQIHVAKEAVRNKTYEIEPFTDINSYISNINIYIRHAIDSTAEQLKKQNLIPIIEKISSAKEIFTFGIGASRISSSLLADNLSILGKNVKKMNSIHDLYLWLKLEEKNGVVVVLFSNTIKTKEIKDVLEICKDYQLNTVVVTGRKQEKLSENIHYITFNPFEKEVSDGLEMFTPKFSQMYVVDVVTSYMKKRQSIAGQKNKKISNKYLIYND